MVHAGPELDFCRPPPPFLLLRRHRPPILLQYREKRLRSSAPLFSYTAAAAAAAAAAFPGSRRRRRRRPRPPLCAQRELGFFRGPPPAAGERERKGELRGRRARFPPGLWPRPPPSSAQPEKAASPPLKGGLFLLFWYLCKVESAAEAEAKKGAFIQGEFAAPALCHAQSTKVPFFWAVDTRGERETERRMPFLFRELYVWLRKRRIRNTKPILLQNKRRVG